MPVTLDLHQRHADHEREQHAERDGRRDDVDEKARFPVEQKAGDPGRRDGAKEDQQRIAPLERWHDENDEHAEHGEDACLRPPRPPRPDQERAIEDVLDRLRVDLHTRHPLGHRRRLVVGEPDGGHADHHDLPGKVHGRHLAREHVRGGDEAVLVVPAVMDPDRAIGLGGNP